MSNHLERLIGLTDVKRLAAIQMASSIKRKTVFGHTLLTGIGGTGKTSIVRAIALDLGYHLNEHEGVSFKHRAALYEALKRSMLEAKTRKARLLFFIDEIHRLNHTMQEALYYPMVENRVGNDGIEPFCLFGATTRSDLLDRGSFVSRFYNVWDIGRYDEFYIQQIIATVLRDHQTKFDINAVENLAGRCLGIPRIAVKLTHKMLDYLAAHSIDYLQHAHVNILCEMDGIDCCGLDRQHRHYLQLLYQTDKPMGLGTIAATLGMNRDIIASDVEPILLALGLIVATTRGRQITELGRTKIT